MLRVLIFSLIISLGYGFTTSNQKLAESSVVLENKIVISPNPAISTTKVFSKNATLKIKQVEVYSIVNENVISVYSKVPAQSVELNVFKLKNGKYFVKVFFSDGSDEVATLIKTN